MVESQTHSCIHKVAYHCSVCIPEFGKVCLTIITWQWWYLIVLALRKVGVLMQNFMFLFFLFFFLFISFFLFLSLLFFLGKVKLYIQPFDFQEHPFKMIIFQNVNDFHWEWIVSWTIFYIESLFFNIIRLPATVQHSTFHVLFIYIRNFKNFAFNR